MNITPSFKDFKKLSANYNLIPVYTEITADILTPVSAFFNISKGLPHSFLLESVEGGEKSGRFSFISAEPSFIVKEKDGILEIGNRKASFKSRVSGSISDKLLKKVEQASCLFNKFEGKKNIFEAIRNIFKDISIAPLDDLPPFIGGAVGYFAYDVVKYIEDLPSLTIDDLKLPDAYFLFTDSILIFDHLKHKIKIVCCTNLENDKQNLQGVYNNSCEKIAKLYKKLFSSNFLDLVYNTQNYSRVKPTAGSRKCHKTVKFASNVTKKEYMQMVDTAKEYIRAGDIFQVVLSQRFSTKTDISPFEIYRVLRSLNPSPYMFYLHLNDMTLVGASPEILVTVRDNEVIVRPIAGTRPRPPKASMEAETIKDLLSDEKERAEHIMLVDLGRNDVGRIAVPGTVRVDDFMTIEKYSHVFHIVSNVTGKLKRGFDSIDVLKACFPAGTVSGAPKVRAMEIIEELEKTKRGPYAGAVGYISYSGFFDTCIGIRTIVIKNGIAYIQAGAGIVADSNPETEYYETLNKAKALMKAIEIATGYSL